MKTTQNQDILKATREKWHVAPRSALMGMASPSHQWQGEPGTAHTFQGQRRKLRPQVGQHWPPVFHLRNLLPHTQLPGLLILESRYSRSICISTFIPTKSSLSPQVSPEWQQELFNKSLCPRPAPKHCRPHFPPSRLNENTDHLILLQKSLRIQTLRTAFSVPRSQDPLDS